MEGERWRGFERKVGGETEGVGNKLGEVNKGSVCGMW